MIDDPIVLPRQDFKYEENKNMGIKDTHSHVQTPALYQDRLGASLLLTHTSYLARGRRDHH